MLKKLTNSSQAVYWIISLLVSIIYALLIVIGIYILPIVSFALLIIWALNMFVLRKSYTSFKFLQKAAFMTLRAGVQKSPYVAQFMEENSIKVFEAGYEIGKKTIETGENATEMAILQTKWSLKVLWGQLKRLLT